MNDFKDEYVVADQIYEQYEAQLWDLIKDANKEDLSLIKLANKLREAKTWETNLFKN